MRTVKRLQRNHAGLLVVDLQEKLVPAMFEKERAVTNAVRLIRGASVLDLPVWVTEQYPHGLGSTVPEVAAAVPGFAPLEKLAFSACGAAGMRQSIEATGRRQVILCGIECHVCVMQTCLDLLEIGLDVFVVADAVSSRTPANWKSGLDRMRDSGAVIVSTEMVIFELLGAAGTPQFKQVLPLVK